MNTLYRMLSELHLADASGRKTVRTLYSSVKRTDNRGEITQLAHYVAASTQHKTMLNKAALMRIGEAHLCLWVAYSLIDSIIDNEVSCENISLAVILHRFAFIEYLNLNLSPNTINEVYRQLDQANRYELAHLRLVITDKHITIPAKLIARHVLMKHLSNRTKAHTLPALLVLENSTLTDNDQHALAKAIHAYAIVRQLNDDLYDWVDDLRNGRITYVIRELLAKENLEAGDYQIDPLVALLKRRFFYGGMQSIIEAMQKTLISTERTFNEQVGSNSTFVTAVIEPMKKSLELTLRQHTADHARLNAAREKAGLSHLQQHSRTAQQPHGQLKSDEQ